MVIGYVVAAALGMVDFSSIGEASWFSMVKPFAWGVNFNVGAILTICAVHIGTLMEMVGDTTGLVTAVSNRLPTSEGIIQDHRGGGITGMFASAFNGAPVITGSANVGIVAMTGVGSRFVTGLGGIIFLAFAVFPKLAQLLALIPNCYGRSCPCNVRPDIRPGSGLSAWAILRRETQPSLAIALAIGIGGNFGVANLAFLPSTVTTIFTSIPRYGPGCPCVKT